MSERDRSGGSVARHIRVRGNVQGVFFRDSTRRRSQERGLAGWVRNDPDGSVEAWLEGPEPAVDEVERWMRQGGPPHARVRDVRVEEVPPEGLEGFQVRR